MAVLTNLNIGRNGRLGNQLFQAAAAIGLSHSLNTDVLFPRVWTAPSRLFHNGENWRTLNDEIISALWKGINPETGETYLPNNQKLLNLAESKGGHLPNIYPQHLDRDTLIDPTQLINLDGYFQSEKYFQRSTAVIRKLFQPKKTITDYIDSKYRLDQAQRYASLHVRRGDYVKLEESHPDNPHPTQSLDYYQSALDRLKPDHVLVFSDDLDWCKNNLVLDNATFISERGHTEEEKDQTHPDFGKRAHLNLESDFTEMILMSRCQDHVISNSSFSWWGAWLNPNKNKRVIAPKLWFSEGYAQKSTLNPQNYLNDLIPEGWEIA